MSVNIVSAIEEVLDAVGLSVIFNSDGSFAGGSDGHAFILEFNPDVTG